MLTRRCSQRLRRTRRRPGTTRAVTGCPLQVYLDQTREALGGLLRPDAGSNTADDHKAVLDPALAQIPAEYVESLEILVRADSPASHGLIDYCRRGQHAVLGRLRADRAGPRRDP